MNKPVGPCEITWTIRRFQVHDEKLVRKKGKVPVAKTA